MNTARIDDARPEPTPSATPVLDRVRQLVESKTRFDPSDIRATQETARFQSYQIEVGYTLFTQLVKRSINGNFNHSREDLRHDSAEQAVANARAESAERTSAAMEQLKAQLGPQEVRYDAIAEGRYLQAVRSHFHLPQCQDCAGEGKNICDNCNGRCTETCTQCHGHCNVQCPVFQCLNGKVNCNTCFGNGQVAESYTDYVTVNYAVYDSQGRYSHNASRTDSVSKTRWVHCYNSACRAGKVNCSNCGGTSQVQCPTCHARGIITCRRCTGAGYLRCDPCAGTGKLGMAARLEIGINVGYQLHLPDDAPPEAQAIVSKEALHAMPALSQYLQRSSVAFAHHSATATFASAFGIFRLEAQCNGHDYLMVAYGSDYRWLITGDIVEDLLYADLRALSQALDTLGKDGMFATEIDSLLEPLSAVTASEINSDVLESLLNGTQKEDRRVDAFLSDEYVNQVRSGVMGSLRHIYVRSAKRLALNVYSMALVSTLLVGYFVGAGTVLLSVLGLAALTTWLFKRSVNSKLIRAMHNPDYAKRAISIAAKAGVHRIAMYWLHGALATGAASGYYLLNLLRQWQGVLT